MTKINNVNNNDNPVSIIRDLDNIININVSKNKKVNSLRSNNEDNKSTNSFRNNNEENKSTNSIRNNNKEDEKHNDFEDFQNNINNKHKRQIKSDSSNNSNKKIIQNQIFMRNSQEHDKLSNTSKEIFNHTRSINLELRNINNQNLNFHKNENIAISRQKNNYGDENSERQSDDIKEIQNNEINLHILEDKIKTINEKDEFTIIENNPLEKGNNFFSCLFGYFREREIFLIAFLGPNNKTPKFINRSLFMFSLSIIFIINCFFFDESLLHKRYLNARKEKYNNFSYFFKKELKISIYTALISNAVKMFFIKIIINWIFKITKSQIKMMSDSLEEGLNDKELEDLNFKRVKYLKNYFRNVRIYCFLIFVINVFIAYICICYGAIFSNSHLFFILSFITSYIMSFIFCFILCFIIIIIYKIWRKTNSLIAVAAYILLSRLY